MGIAILENAGGAGASSDDVTALNNCVLKYLPTGTSTVPSVECTAITNESDDEPAQGTIPLKQAETYNTSTSNQTISKGQYLNQDQVIRAVTTSGIASTSIRSGKNIQVGDAGDPDRIANVTGTWTSDATATASTILSGKTAGVKGEMVTGNIPSIGATTYDTTGSDRVIISEGKYISGNQTVRGVTTSGNISAGNIRSGVTVKVGDTGNTGKYVSTTGTYTSTSSPIASDKVLKGYQGCANGSDIITGSIEDYSGTTQTASMSYDASTQIATLNIPNSGYYTTSSTVKTEVGKIKSVISFEAGPLSSTNVVIQWTNPSTGPYNGVRILRKEGKNQTFTGPYDSSATVISSGTIGSSSAASAVSQYVDSSAASVQHYTYIVYAYFIVDTIYHFDDGSVTINTYRYCNSNQHCHQCSYNCTGGNCCDIEDSSLCSEWTCPGDSCKCDSKGSPCHKCYCNGDSCSCENVCICNGTYS